MENQIVCGEPIGPRICDVSPAEDYKLLLVFTNGERRLFDAKPLLSYSVFKPLQNKQFFESVKVEYGSISWPHDIDYCPDTLYMESVLIDTEGQNPSRDVPDDIATPDDIDAHNRAVAEYQRGETTDDDAIDWN